MSGFGNIMPLALATLEPSSRPKTTAPKLVKCKRHFTAKKGKCIENTKKKKSKAKKTNRRAK